MADLPDYRNDPEAYEIEERSRPDEMMMLDRACELGAELLNRFEAASVLDLCCGTGLSLRGIAGHTRASVVVGVDNCESYLRYAEAQYSRFRPRVTFLLADAVDVALPRNRWDLLMLASAYHHIEDSRKLRFLARVATLLGPQGRAVMAENLLPIHGSGQLPTYADAVRLFYREVLETAKAANPDLPAFVEGLIRRVAKYGFDGDYEYKTDRGTLMRLLAKAGLIVEHEERVWPMAGPLADLEGGNYVMVLRIDARAQEAS